MRLDSRDEAEGAETARVWVLESADSEFPPYVVGNDDVSAAAEIQGDVGQEGDEEG